MLTATNVAKCDSFNVLGLKMEVAYTQVGSVGLLLNGLVLVLVLVVVYMPDQ
jgi:hypothetical protein